MYVIVRGCNHNLGTNFSNLMRRIIYLSQFGGFLLLLAIVTADTSSEHPSKPSEVKKRALYHFEDLLLGPPPPPYRPLSYVPQQLNPTNFNPTIRPNKWTNIYGFDDAAYHQLFNQFNGFNYGYPTQATPPPPRPSRPSVFDNGFGFQPYAPPHDYETSYVLHDGRVVKQYSVHERHHNDHPDPRDFQAFPSIPTQALPAIPTQALPAVPNQFPTNFPQSNINIAQPRTFFTNSQDPSVNPNQNRIPTFLNRNHGPIALGSGSIGVVQLPSGDVYLGSGALGYISHKDHYDNVVGITSRRQKSHPRGPLTFGHSHL